MNQTRKIWLYWENVYSDSMPEYIRLCYETIVAQSGDWEVVLLTPENVRDYVPALRHDFFDIPEVAHKADYIRGAILDELGGMWMDIDTVALRPVSLISDLLALDGAVFYGWQSFQPSIGLVAAEPGHPLIAEWRKKMDETLDSNLSQKWAGIGYDLLWPLAKEHKYTHIAHTICAPTHYTETEKFLADVDPSQVLKPETVVMQLYNKMFFKTYGSMDRESILESNSLIAECFRRSLNPDPLWEEVSAEMSQNPSLAAHALRRSRDGQGNVGTIYVKMATDRRSSLTG
ncbi:hypothetical protein GCM10009700_15640 [Brevibacterium sanguinis]|uniref:glycosyltransferase family 32 protein n=1 Tax=Brevibacterium sanguinis TaxID=232444 RepID=UPI0031D090EF